MTDFFTPSTEKKGVITNKGWMIFGVACIMKYGLCSFSCCYGCTAECKEGPHVSPESEASGS